MIYKTEESPVIYSKENVTGKKLAETVNQEFVWLKLEKNGFIEPHTLEVDVNFFVISGEGEIFLDGNTLKMEKGNFISVAAGSSRGVKAETTHLELLVIKNRYP